MNIDITDLVRDIAPMDYAASAAEIGTDARRATWEAACEDAQELLAHAFDREAFENFFMSFGAWCDDELATYSDAECAALMLQFIAGDIREADFSKWRERHSDPPGAAPFTEAWWPQYGAAGLMGMVSGRFSRDNGRIYYNIAE